jgi:sulfonate transport system permease protein
VTIQAPAEPREGPHRSLGDGPDIESEPRRESRIASRLGNVVLGLIVPAVLLLLWLTLAASGSFSSSQLPSPGEVLRGLGELIERGTFWTHVAITVQRVLLGFAAGASLGILIGSLVGLSPWASRIFAPTIHAIRAVPSLAWVPVLVLWLGIYEGPKVTLVAIGAFFPVFTTVASGFQHADRKLIEVGRAYGLRGVQLATQVILPSAAPTIFSGLRLGLAQSWLFVVAAELIASSKGLGFLLIDSQNTLRTDILLMSIILLAVLGKTTDFLLSLIERRALRWT